MDLTELNPHNWVIYASVVFSLPVTYLVGQFFIDRSETPSLSIGLRMAVGLLVLLSALATWFTTGNTGFIFYLGLFALMGIKRRLCVDTEDLRVFGAKKLALLVSVLLVGMTVDGNRAELMQDDFIYVGNSDIGHYAGYGYSLYENGVETNPEKITPEKKPTLYHFGDLWMNGFYTYFVGVLPYYAHTLVTRWLLIIIISLILYGWSRSLRASRPLALLIPALYLFAVSIDLFEFKEGDLSLFHLFRFYYPAYCEPAQMIVALGFLPFWYILTQNRASIGLIGIWFLPFLNGGILTVPAVAGVLYFSFGVLQLAMSKTLTRKSFLQHGMLLLLAMLPLLYYKLTGRLFSSSQLELGWNQIYMTAHTFVRSCISQLFALPYLVGLLYFNVIKNDQGGFRPLIVFIATLVGTLVSFAIIFPLLQGNSIKILQLHFSAILVPACLIGLLGLRAVNSNRLKYAAYISIGIIAFQTSRALYATNSYQLVFDWSVYLDEYKKQATLSLSDYVLFKETISKKNAGYFMYNEKKEYDRANYSAFTPWKALFPGTVFFRMNSSEQDTLISKEQLNYFKLSTLGYFTYQNEFDSTKTVDAMMDYVNPDVIIRPKEGDYVFPSAIASEYQDSVNSENYVLYKK